MLAFCASIVADAKTVNRIICGFNVPNFSQIRQYRNQFIDIQLSTGLELFWGYPEDGDSTFLQTVLTYNVYLRSKQRYGQVEFFSFRSL